MSSRTAPNSLVPQTERDYDFFPDYRVCPGRTWRKKPAAVCRGDVARSAKREVWYEDATRHDSDPIRAHGGTGVHGFRPATKAAATAIRPAAKAAATAIRPAAPPAAAPAADAEPAAAQLRPSLRTWRKRGGCLGGGASGGRPGSGVARCGSTRSRSGARRPHATGSSSSGSSPVQHGGIPAARVPACLRGWHGLLRHT